MERYKAYKDSGVKWIGMVPEKWSVLYPKKLFSLRKERALPEDVQLTASQKNGIVTQEEYTRLENQRVVQVITGEDILKHVEAGDFVISMRSFQGGLEYSTISGKISSAYVMLYATDRELVCDGYYKHLFKSTEYIQALQSTSNLVRDGQALRYANFVQVYLPHPPISEQRVIADYLDAKTAEVDALVADCEREIGLLQEYRKAIITEAVTKGLDPDTPMKDSGIEWIGEIPEEWNTTRLGEISYIRARLGWRALKADEYVDEGYPMYSAFNIVNEKFVTEPVNYITEFRFMESPEIMMAVGDIMLVKDGAGVGKCAVIRELERPCTVNGSIALITPEESQDSRYLYYFFESNAFQHFSRMLMGGMGVPHLFQRDIKLMRVIQPDLSTQSLIADYLDDRTAEIESLIEAKQAMVEKLREYRRSLISEAVTGKFKVPGV